uniref:Sterol carrier protein 2 n=1 Tax=Cacopsylla melanoneura TaxID=428564 RepID=A0A8D8LH06_9HEMI
MVVPKRKVFVIGVGMTQFKKPSDNADYPEIAKEALINALTDAGISINQVQQACCGYVYGDSTSGQRALYEVGMTGIPVFNVNNNCSTGASALMLAKQFIESGSDCTLALGFEKMQRGSLGSTFSDRANPVEKHVESMINLVGLDASPITAQMFGNAGLEHMKLYGTKEEHFAKIAYKNHLHSVNNPNSQFRDKYTLEQIMKSPKVFGPLTKLQCCPTSDGAAAAILVSEDFVRRYGLEANAVEIVGLEMATDTASTFNSDSCIKIVGFDMTKAAADKLYEKTRVKPTDIDVIELHDCFSANELITYEALGLCPVGKAKDFIDSGANTYGGRTVVNPSGGLISKGHPLGATGLAQCAELCWQLRGEAGKRQVPNARLALQHNLGLGGACVVALYRLGFPTAHRPRAATAQIAQHPVAASNVAEDPSVFQCDSMFKLLEQAMNEDDQNLVEGFRGIYGFEVRNGPGGKTGRWVINAMEGKGKIEYNGKDKPQVTFIVNDADILDLISGRLDPQKAFFQNKIKIQGNMGLAMKLTKLQKQAGPKIAVLRSKL